MTAQKAAEMGDEYLIPTMQRPGDGGTRWAASRPSIDTVRRDERAASAVVGQGHRFDAIKDDGDWNSEASFQSRASFRLDK